MRNGTPCSQAVTHPITEVKKKKKEFAQPRSWTASPHAVTHPGTDVARSCLTSEIGLSPGEITFPEGTRIRRYLFSNIWSKRTPNAIFFFNSARFFPPFSPILGSNDSIFQAKSGPILYYNLWGTCVLQFQLFWTQFNKAKSIFRAIFGNSDFMFFSIVKLISRKKNGNWKKSEKFRHFSTFLKEKIIFQTVLCFWKLNSHGNWKKSQKCRHFSTYTP